MVATETVHGLTEQLASMVAIADQASGAGKPVLAGPQDGKFSAYQQIRRAGSARTSHSLPHPRSHGDHRDASCRPKKPVVTDQE